MLLIFSKGIEGSCSLTNWYEGKLVQKLQRLKRNLCADASEIENAERDYEEEQ